jgi:hypothetical protein
MQSHFEITQPYMQYLHSRSLQNYACGVEVSLNEDPTLYAIPAFWVTK